MHRTLVANVGVTVVNVAVDTMVLETGVVGAIQATIPTVTCHRKRIQINIFIQHNRFLLQNLKVAMPS
jgi:hypothetical protein